jgi:rubrerythrin
MGIVNYEKQSYCSFCGIRHNLKDASIKCPICGRRVRTHPRNYGVNVKKRQFERAL